MTKYLLRLIFLISSTILLHACDDDGPVPVQPVEPPATVSRTVLVYMVADNSLGTTWGSDEADIREMIKGIKDGELNGGRLIVYHNRPGTDRGNVPQLREYTADGKEKVLKNYPDDKNVYSTDPARISEVMADMKALAPAEEYGLVLWSHANGWLTMPSSRGRAYGEDRGVSISIPTLARTLEGEEFRFIYFDCCLMGNVESLYELRHIAPVMVAHPTEASIDGMPYDRNIPVMFDPTLSAEEAMLTAADNTFAYYKENVNGYFDGCQIAVYRTAGLENLARATRDIFTAVKGIPQFATYIQPYCKKGSVQHSYDMDNYMELLARTDYPELLAAWRSALDDVVIGGAATRYGIGGLTGEHRGGLTIDRFCGLGCYVIDHPSDITAYGYNTLQWYDDVVSAYDFN